MPATSAGMTRSELLHPRPQLDLQAPGAARLLEHRHVGLGDGIRIEQAVGRGRVAGPAALGIPHPAVDHEMRDVDALGLQLARHRLRQPAQRELAHGERRRLGIALHAGRGAGEEDRAARRGFTMRRAASCPTRKPAEGRHLERLCHLFRIEIQERPARAIAGVVEHHVEVAERAVHLGEQLRHALGLRRIRLDGERVGLLRERRRACPYRARPARPCTHRGAAPARTTR